MAWGPALRNAGMSDTSLTVSQLTRQIRALLEGEFGQVWVEGEISNHKLQQSGHHYFTLKDSGAQISCVMFRGQATRAGRYLQDGAAVQVQGELSVYEPRGQYQLIVRNVQPMGLGALQARFEALKRKLDEQGLFDSEWKKPIPKMPTVVALVTAPGGAAVRDMVNVLSRRAPWVRILIYPVRVQGAGAELEIVHAIQQLNQAAALGLPEPDTIIVGRGGGSLEDLWCFNEEVLARAIHASRIPIISAVGHEIDFTIADFVADLRAPTPSAAAELVAPDATELTRHLEAMQRSLGNRVQERLTYLEQVLSISTRGALLREPERFLERAAQSVDLMQQRVDEGVEQLFASYRDSLHEREQTLVKYHPQKVLADAKLRTEMAAFRLRQSMDSMLSTRAERLTSLKKVLKALGPQSVLSRGFTFTTKADGTLVTKKSALKDGDEIVTRLSDGDVRSRVVEG
jgi:exodeoxyribonuclease VII large subunit